MVRKKIVRPKFHASIETPDSSWVGSIMYDPKTQILDALLKNGKRYRYDRVTAKIFAELTTSESVGKAFNRLVKPLGHRTLPRKAGSAIVARNEPEFLASVKSLFVVNYNGVKYSELEEEERRTISETDFNALLVWMKS